MLFWPDYLGSKQLVTKTPDGVIHRNAKHFLRNLLELCNTHGVTAVCEYTLQDDASRWWDEEVTAINKFAMRTNSHALNQCIANLRARFPDPLRTAEYELDNLKMCASYMGKGIKLIDQLNMFCGIVKKAGLGMRGCSWSWCLGPWMRCCWECE